MWAIGFDVLYGTMGKVFWRVIGSNHSSIDGLLQAYINEVINSTIFIEMPVQ